MAADKFPIEAGHVLMFARAIADDNPVYRDPDAAGGVIAPPTFVQAGAQFDPDFALRPRPGEPWLGSGGRPSGVAAETGGSGGGSLHAEQHFEYHLPVRAGDVLSVLMEVGDTWEKESRRGGKLLFREFITRYRNQEGELAVTARAVSVRSQPATAAA